MSNDPSLQKPDDSEIVDNHDALLHESNASREGSEALSPKLIMFFVALAFVGAGYLVWNSGGFKANVFNPARVAWDGAGSGGPAAAPDPMVVGKKVFTQTCQVCHQANGKGVPGQFPPLAGSEWVLASEGWHGDNHIVKIVLNGLQGVVTVEGAQYNNAMAPW
ncbi:MAG: cytochrome c, partial [Bacteroidia bacterium]